MGWIIDMSIYAMGFIVGNLVHLESRNRFPVIINDSLENPIWIN